MSETYRHELKYTVDWGTYCSLRQRLKTVLKPDSHAGPNGCYHIHSIYFDNPDDKVLREKINGVALREKWRVRWYNDDLGHVMLEKKIKHNELCLKLSAPLTEQECRALAAGEDSFLLRNYGAQSGALYKPEGVDAGRGGKNDDNADGMKTAMQPETGDADESADGMPDFTPFGGNGLTPPEGQDGTDDTNRPSPPQRPDEVGGEMGKTGESSAIPELPEDFTPGQTGGIFETSGGADLNYTDDELDSYQTIWDGEVTDTSKADHRRVVTALKHAAEGTELDTYLDVDNLLKYMAVHVFSVNLDSLSGNMAHNYYLYESDGKLNLLPWDYNLAFGGFGGSADSVINSDISDPFAVTDFFDALLENETYRAQYEAYLRQLAEEYVQGGTLESFYTRTRSQIDQLVQDDPTAFYDYDAYDDAAQMLLQVVQLRGRSVLLQLSGAEETVDTTGIDLRIMGGMNGGFGGGEAPQGGPDRMS